MKQKHSTILSFAFLCLISSTYPQADYPIGRWKASWIAHPEDPGNQFGVFHFRKTFELKSKPSTFKIHVSGDNVYRLFVNGNSICTGPARSDLANWNFETLDISSYLKEGKNLIAATVWNFAEYRPYAQISYRTAFIVQGNTSNEDIINTNKSWRVIKNSAYSPLPLDRKKLQTYIVIAEGEKVDGEKYIWDFEKPDYSDSSWAAANELQWHPAKTRTYGTDGNWMLVPRKIPLPEESLIRFAAIRRSTLPFIPADLLHGKSTLQIPARSKASILIDQSYLVNAYPSISISRGNKATITFTYAEALYNENRQKGNRDSIDNKKILGVQDMFVSDGKKRVYTPLNYRTYRYVQLDIETKGQALLINDVYGIFTGYPFKENASFKSDRSSLAKIWEVGWRTARMCAVDTYFDCPYYEQLQYVGDTRIQALISLYVSGDDRLMKKAIDDIGNSFISDGLTQSRFPSRDLQVIPTFSLWWICMVHDYWMHRKDDAFVRSHLKRIENVLHWYTERIDKNGMLGRLSWWQFVDWSWPWKSDEEMGGVPSGVRKGGSSIISLQFAYTLQRAGQLMDQFGEKDLSKKYLDLAKSITNKTFQLCWDNTKRLLADTYDKKEFSQHANIMAILTDAIPVGEEKHLLERILTNKTITQATYYFTFYLFEALKKVESGDKFLGLIQPWQDMINIGLSTFAENPEPTRSDCHAWSASPNYQLLSLVCGIKPSAPGFEKIHIQPYFGELNWIEGKMPHPRGNISVHFEKVGDGIKAMIELPDGITGTFSWKGETLELKSGKQDVSL